MSEEILVNVTPREGPRGGDRKRHAAGAARSSVARRRGVVGNIYKGKVQRVMPGMQAAFVEVGLERRPSSPHARRRRARGPRRRWSIGRAAALFACHRSTDRRAAARNMAGRRWCRWSRTRSAARARLTTQISIPSRYLVLLPRSRWSGSRRGIEDEAERARRKGIVTELAASPGGYGYIIRTNAEGQPAERVAEDIASLSRVWNVVERRGRESPTCSIIYRTKT